MNHIFQTIEGWFSFPNLYREMVDRFPENSHFVEVGTWMGRSASFMAVEIINSNKKIKFDCVDTWNGSDEHKNFDVILKDTCYETFIKNIEPVKHIINPIRMDSEIASKTYKDNSLDFVFIDASHDYENVKKDILNWYPKVKQNGVLAGHDYNETWSGVIDAVNEFISNNDYSLYINKEDCWGIIKK
jgi:hypothetical protein